MSARGTDKEIGEFFDRCAGKGLMYEFDPEEQRKLSQLLRRWNLRSGQRVLEPGCGSGRLTQCLAEAVGPQGEVYACDLSAMMIRLARERGLPAHVCLAEGSTLKVERPDGWFDAVICLNVFPHLVDKEDALDEFARVLKPGGVLWINHFMGRDSLNHFHQEASPQLEGHVLPCPHTMRRLLDGGGFELAEVSDGPEGYSLEARKKVVN